MEVILDVKYIYENRWDVFLRAVETICPCWELVPNFAPSLICQLESLINFKFDRTSGKSVISCDKFPHGTKIRLLRNDINSLPIIELVM